MKHSPAVIRQKYLDGTHLTDEEVLEGLVFFRRLSNDLSKVGLIFGLAEKEAYSTYVGLERYAKARNLISTVD